MPKRHRPSPCVTFDLTRTGQFHIRTKGSNHCGTLPSLDVKYTVEVSCLDTELSSRGFMFDQIGIDQYFQHIRVTSLSCERLAQRCGRAIQRLIATENSGLIPITLRVTLSPQPFAAQIVYDYHDDNAVKILAAKS